MKSPCFCNSNVASSGYFMYNMLSGMKGFFNGPTVGCFLSFLVFTNSLKGARGNEFGRTTIAY